MTCFPHAPLCFHQRWWLIYSAATSRAHIFIVAARISVWLHARLMTNMNNNKRVSRAWAVCCDIIGHILNQHVEDHRLRFAFTGGLVHKKERTKKPRLQRSCDTCNSSSFTEPWDWSSGEITFYWEWIWFVILLYGMRKAMLESNL